MLVSDSISKHDDNPDLQKIVVKDTELKKWLVSYVGNSYAEEVKLFEKENNRPFDWDGDVTVEMIVETFSKDFPEFLMAIAEENFIRGYRQAFSDMETGMQMAAEEEEADGKL